MGESDSGTSSNSSHGMGWFGILTGYPEMSRDGTAGQLYTMYIYFLLEVPIFRKGRSKTEKDVLKQENEVQKKEIWSFL